MTSSLIILYICIFAYLLICLFAYLLICLFAYLLICLFAYLLISTFKLSSHTGERQYNVELQQERVLLKLWVNRVYGCEEVCGLQLMHLSTTNNNNTSCCKSINRTNMSNKIAKSD